MRILWFTNTPSLAAEFLNQKVIHGGWIASLETQISKNENIELGVAFHQGFKPINQFKIERTTYFPIPLKKSKGKLLGLKERWQHTIESDSILQKYLEIVEKFNPDIIHIFGTENAFGLMAQYVKIPVIIQIQGNLTICQNKWFSGLSNVTIFRYSRVKNLILGYGVFHQYYLFKKRAKREIQIFKNCQYFIGRTDWDRRITKVLSSNGLYFHCDELLREIFYTSVWESSNSSNQLLSILSATTYKGLETLLETAFLLKRKSINFVWVIAGVSGEEELIPIIEKSTKLKFSEQNVYFLGALNPEELKNEMLNSKCYVHTSHIENSPNSVCEAMLLGMPIVATFAGGTSSLINNNVDGLLVQDGDPHSMSGAIIELFENTKQAINMGENARKIALARHNHQIISDNLIEIYHSF